MIRLFAGEYVKESFDTLCDEARKSNQCNVDGCIYMKAKSEYILTIWFPYRIKIHSISEKKTTSYPELHLLLQ